MEALAPPQEREIREEPAVRRFPRAIRGGLVALRRLMEFELFQDRRVRSSACFVTWGCCVVIHGTVLNHRDNPDHLLAGYALFTAGAGLMYLAIGGAAGGGPLGRAAAARVEEAIGGYLC